MTAAAHKLAAPRPSLLEVFIARAEARALLWQAGELDLHDAVDELQAAAVRDGLIDELGQDRVQQLICEAFAPLRNDNDVLDERAPNLLKDQEIAPTESTPPASVAAATIKAAEYLVQQGDAERFRSWLDRHSADERTAIRRHLEAK